MGPAAERSASSAGLATPGPSVTLPGALTQQQLRGPGGALQNKNQTIQDKDYVDSHPLRRLRSVVVRNLHCTQAHPTAESSGLKETRCT